MLHEHGPCLSTPASRAPEQADWREQPNMILLGLGGNLPSRQFGAPQSTLEAALAALEERGVRMRRRSRWYRSRPVPDDGQPWYVNGVAELETTLPPDELLARVLEIESRFWPRAPAALGAAGDRSRYPGLPRSQQLERETRPLPRSYRIRACTSARSYWRRSPSSRRRGDIRCSSAPRRSCWPRCRQGNLSQRSRRPRRRFRRGPLQARSAHAKYVQIWRKMSGAKVRWRESPLKTA